jgi:hypothetical protein
MSGFGAWSLRSLSALLPAMLLALPGWAMSAPVAEVMAVIGDASTGRVAQPRKLLKGDQLEVGAELRTGPKGRVRLRFIDGSTVVLSDNTQFRIERFEAGKGEPRDAALALELGLMGQTVTKSDKGQWSVRTPTAVTAVRGTEFVVEVGDDRGTDVQVQTGRVDVSAPPPPAPPPAASAASDAPQAKDFSLPLPEPPPVQLLPSMAGVHCSADGCVVPKAFGDDGALRLKRRLARLTGV